MKRKDQYLSVAAALLTFGTYLSIPATQAYAQGTPPQNLTPEQKAAIEAARKKKGPPQKAGPNAGPANNAGKPNGGPNAGRPNGGPNAGPKTVQPKQFKPQPKVVQPKTVPNVQPKALANPPPVKSPAPLAKTPPVVKDPAARANGQKFKHFGRRPDNPQQPDGRTVGKPPLGNQPQVNNPVVQPKSNNPAFPAPNQKAYNPAFPPAGQKTYNPGLPRAPGAPANLDALKSQRTQVVAKRGGAVFIKEPDQRTIVKRNNQSMIVHNEASRFQRVSPNAKVTREGKNNVTIIQRPNNVQIYNITDSNGQLIKRYRRDGSGRDTMLIDNESNRRKSRWGRNLAIGLGVGAGIVAGAAILNAVADVPPPRVDLPPRKYVVDYEDASDDDIYEAFTAPPVDRIERRYTLDEVRATPALRNRMRRVDLDDINFETGSWDVDQSQYPKLERVARVLQRVIERNPNEVFMIEGYTDAVGSDEDNLTLSDRRAESVAVILSEQFQLPPENLTTQGYGEQYLKVPTEGPERTNRRVAIRRITPLISQQ